MGLKDALRALRGNPEDGVEQDVPIADVPEPNPLTPRTGGLYEAGPDPDGAGSHGAGSHLYLRFSGTRVRELVAPDVAAARAAADTAPRVGEHGSAGRFLVQERFERPVIFTVLESDSDGSGFTARRTNSATGTSTELRYRFVPDDDSTPA